MRKKRRDCPYLFISYSMGYLYIELFMSEEISLHKNIYPFVLNFVI